MCRRVDKKTPEFRPYIVSRHTSTGLDSAGAMEPDHTPKIAMPMTAASVAQRRMGFKAPRAQKYEGQSPYLVSQGFSRGGSDEWKKRGAILLWIQQGGVYGHSDGRSPEDGREQASKGRSVGLTSAENTSGESSGC